MSASIHHEVDDNSVERFDLNEIVGLQSEWRAIPGINQQGIDNIANILRKVTDPNITEAEIVKSQVSVFVELSNLLKPFTSKNNFKYNQLDMLNIVLNNDVAEDKQVKLGIATNDTNDKTDSSNNSESKIKKSDKIIVLLSGEPLPIEDSSELEKVLSSKLNPIQTTRAVTFFKGIKADQLEDNLVIQKFCIGSVECINLLCIFLQCIFQNDLIKVAVKATLPDTHEFKNGKIIPKAVEMKNE